MKNVLLVLCALFVLARQLTTIAASPTELLKTGTVVYELPYPGTTPESPLYFFKQIRDQFIEFFTRDNLKKAEFLLLSSDKRAHMALILARKGKSRQAVETLADAEERSLRIPPLLAESKKQGSAPEEQFVYRLKLSNAKHKEVVQELAKLLPQGQEEQVLNAILDLNQRVTKDLDQL
jgi:hypothetical protein